MKYQQISPETIDHLHKSYGSLKNSPIGATTRVLVELRVSLMNGCEYCINMHTQEAKKLNISPAKLEALAEWSKSELFSEAEKSALQWTESVTRLERNLPEKRELLHKYYSEREIVDLTAAIAIMNALNRLAISLK